MDASLRRCRRRSSPPRLPSVLGTAAVLSARLGLGKGGLRMAPDDLISPILGVPLGSVTPLALGRPSAADVVLLLDQGIRSQSRVFVHPGVNTASTALAPAGLEAFLQSSGREAVYVDLQAAPQIDKDNPPDLKPIADAATPMVGSDDAVAASTAVAAAVAPCCKPGKKAATATGKAGKAAVPAQRRHDVNAVTEAVVRMTRERLLGEEGDAAVDGDSLRRLTADVAMELNALRNASYAAGFKAAQGAMAAALSTRPS